MRLSLWQKRIPTLLGMILLGAGILTASWLVNSGALFISRAAPAFQPENIRITNLSDTSFTVSYTTGEAALGTLSYTTGREGNKVALDDRDQQTGTPKKYFTHHITIKNLEPQRSYTFTITSQDKTFMDGEKAFSVTTLAPLVESPPAQQPIVGKVTLPGSKTSVDSVVFLVSDNAQVLSVLPKEDGNFILPLNSIRTNELDAYLTLTDTSIITMLATNGKLSSNIKLLATQINPVPPIVLSQNYDFTTTATPLEQNPTATSSGEKVNFPTFSATETTTTQTQPEILSPKSEEEFSDQQPSFRGTAFPGETVEILIQSEHEISTSLEAGADGRWSFRPDTALEPGEHTITIKTKNKNGILQTLTRSFTVYAAGSQFIEPSVSPIQPTPTLAPSPTPTSIPSPTPTPIIVEVTITPPPPTEAPGSSTIIFFAILATLSVGIGSFLLFTNRSRTSL